VRTASHLHWIEVIVVIIVVIKILVAIMGWSPIAPHGHFLLFQV
jgi:hypothetical protein